MVYAQNPVMTYEILKLYMRNLSVESPLTGRLPQQINLPNIDIDIDPMITRVADNHYEVAARFTVSARANDVQLYLIELTQAGFFSISPNGEVHRDELLRRVFPQLIYPAARSNIVNFIVAAGYQPVVLNHIQIENLFATTPLTDKCQQPLERFPFEQAGKVAQEHRPEVPTPRKTIRKKAMVLAGAGIIALLLALRVDWQQYWADFHGGHPAGTQTSVVSGMVAGPPAVSGSVSAEVQSEVSGLPVEQLEQIGRNWLAAQADNAFTVVLLRTDDLKILENIAPPDEGQPLFLVKLAGGGSTGYAVLSGVYGNEDQAKQAAAKSASYRAMKFGDIKGNL